MHTIDPGFADAVDGAQRCFRAVLGAMSRPGRIAALDLVESPPKGLSPAAAAIVLAFADIDAPVWLGARAAPAADWIRFHTGAPIASDPMFASFAFVATDELPDWSAVNLGSNEYPDRSTTLVVETSRTSTDGPLVLRGPGIEDSHRAAIDGIDSAFWARRAELHELFPRGADLIFVSGTNVLAIPRTTRVQA